MSFIECPDCGSYVNTPDGDDTVEQERCERCRESRRAVDARRAHGDYLEAERRRYDPAEPDVFDEDDPLDPCPNHGRPDLI